jgi:branched-chain amino acid transport system permease protein
MSAPPLSPPPHAATDATRRSLQARRSAPVAKGTVLGTTPLGTLLLALVVALALGLPLVAEGHLISLGVLLFLNAYLALSWNVMMGFAGQLSLGHALYFGLGAYTGAVLFMGYGLSPWIAMPVAAGISAAAGAFIGFLGFRFGVKGVYFALLTIAFAEFTRILFDHWGFVGGSSGLFLTVENRDDNDLWMLRGAPEMFYYVLLALLAAGLALSRWLLGRRIGFYWRAIREDQEAAETLGVDAFRYKIAAVAVSAGMTSLAGVVFAFYYNNLYPETVFSIHRSVELILGAIVGGIGTLVGPVLGAALLLGLGEALTAVTEDWGVDGIKQFFYGAFLLAIIVYRPTGIWPWLRTRLKLVHEEDGR